MPCNLAVSIAKAVISEQRLRALLVPDAIKNVVLAYLRQQYAASSPVLLRSSGDVLRYRVGTMLLTIVEGEVTVSEPGGDQEQAEQLATRISELLAAIANRLFQQQVQQALKAVTTRAQSVNVTFEGRSQQAAVFHINL